MSRLTQLFQDVVAGRRPISRHTLQRPSLYVPGLTARPWHDPAAFDWVPQVEAAAPMIRAELLRVLEGGGELPPYVEPGPPGPGESEWRLRYLHDRGQWNALYFELLGRAFPENQARCPVTWNTVRSIPRITTSSFFSVLGPRSHIASHCGPTNAFLRVHLGLLVPPRCEMRVGTETRRWQEGKVWIFDDSFNHEIWNRSDQKRVVLIFYVYHPDLTDEEVAQLVSLRETAGLDEDAAWSKLADDMLAGRLILPQSSAG